MNSPALVVGCSFDACLDIGGSKTVGLAAEVPKFGNVGGSLACFEASFLEENLREDN